MKLLFFDEFRLGVLEGDTVHDVTAAVQKVIAPRTVNVWRLRR